MLFILDGKVRNCWTNASFVTLLFFMMKRNERVFKQRIRLKINQDLWAPVRTACPGGKHEQNTLWSDKGEVFSYKIKSLTLILISSFKILSFLKSFKSNGAPVSFDFSEPALKMKLLKFFLVPILLSGKFVWKLINLFDWFQNLSFNRKSLHRLSTVRFPWWCLKGEAKPK